MSRKTLSSINKKKLRSASRTYTEKYFVELHQRVRGAAWLAKGNRYRENAVRLYEADCASSCVRDEAITSYVSASAPTHAIDGWSFLGRAVDAALGGDVVSAVFFGYYAELRATMALLASEGFGIFNRKHAVICKDGTTQTLSGPGTHDISWLALRHWASLRKSTDLISGFISPRGVSLEQWFSHLAPSVPIAAVSDKWLGLWGVDLRDFNDDHLLRNGSSYRPSQFRLSEAFDARLTSEVIQELWELLEPSKGVKFPNLSIALLRNALRLAGVQEINQHDLGFLGMTTDEESEWSSVLSSTLAPRPLSLAAETSKLGSRTCHLQVICRAALLLSVATESSRGLLTAAQMSPNELQFWWGNFGLDRGLWNEGGEPSDPQDLWSDISDALLDINSWRAQSQDQTVWDMRFNVPKPVAMLGGFEMIGIWGLLP